ncbi:UNKNOWN [Stylonychia lemnae]|uniref:TLDc domain-containing protein n=1 Tax=Stylonychia lemnae TaxID=5949 RepID=A0A078AY22_STYLE|nr:UNKNOWN [Stylonychia lemnae]|eukprot:CDW85683.1 UNKNOWN [Stylonychia lemnae]
MFFGFLGLTGLALLVLQLFSQEIMNLPTGIGEGSLQLWLDQQLSIKGWTDVGTNGLPQFKGFSYVYLPPFEVLYGRVHDYTSQVFLKTVYKYSFASGEWTPIPQADQVYDAKFDQLGRMYILDQNWTLRRVENNSTVVLREYVSDFGISVTGKLYMTVFALDKGEQYDKWIQNEKQSYQYKVFENGKFETIEFMNDEPLLVDKNETLMGSYGGFCVKDISVGADRSLWALNCNKKPGELNDYYFQLIKWDPLFQEWYELDGIYGYKIAAFNEMSIAVLDLMGKIRISTDGFLQQKLKLFKKVSDNSKLEEEQKQENSTKLCSDSKILKGNGLDFIKSNLDKKYKNSFICYSATRDGFNNSIFHQYCDEKGPSLLLIKTTNGKIFGGYTSISWTPQGFYEKDGNSFIFSIDKKAILKVQPSKVENAIFSYQKQGPQFGQMDIYLNLDEKIYMSNLGSTYELLDSNKPQDKKAQEYLAGSLVFQVSEIEVHILKTD